MQLVKKGQNIYWAIFQAQDGTLQTYAYVPKILTHTSQRAEHYIKPRMRMRAHLDTMLTFAAAFVIFSFLIADVLVAQVLSCVPLLLLLC